MKNTNRNISSRLNNTSPNQRVPRLNNSADRTNFKCGNLTFATCDFKAAVNTTTIKIADIVPNNEDK
jgi:hypothetical protein